MSEETDPTSKPGDRPGGTARPGSPGVPGGTGAAAPGQPAAGSAASTDSAPSPGSASTPSSQGSPASPPTQGTRPPVPPPAPPPAPTPSGSPGAPDSPAGEAGRPIPGTAYSGSSPVGYSPPPKRSSAQIRADIEAQRAELGESVEQLRDKVTELTDWRGQLRKHRKEVTIAAVATGFVIGGLLAMRRRR